MLVIRLRRDFVIRQLEKKWLIYMLLRDDFVKCDVETNQKGSRDNSKVSTFFIPTCSLRLVLSFLSGLLLNSIIFSFLRNS